MSLMRFPSIICVASINSPWHVSSPLPSVMIYINTNYVSVLSMNTTILLGKELKELFYIVCNYFITSLFVVLWPRYLPPQCVRFCSILFIQFNMRPPRLQVCATNFIDNLIGYCCLAATSIFPSIMK